MQWARTKSVQTRGQTSQPRTLLIIESAARGHDGAPASTSRNTAGTMTLRAAVGIWHMRIVVNSWLPGRGWPVE
jgi:hypothetical protein